MILYLWHSKDAPATNRGAITYIRMLPLSACASDSLHKVGLSSMGMKRTLLSWSSGKDSVWSLHLLGHQKEHEIVGLLTTFNHTADRVAVHAVRRSLVEAQARAAGIPLWPIDLPWPCTNADYECIMKETCKAAVQAGIAIFSVGCFHTGAIIKRRSNHSSWPRQFQRRTRQHAGSERGQWDKFMPLTDDHRFGCSAGL
jgi:hypothetical protein